jgi:hypothetical protein
MKKGQQVVDCKSLGKEKMTKDMIEIFFFDRLDTINQ